jgi:hypothetical protein
MTGQREFFKELDESVRGHVVFNQGYVMKIKGRGTIRLQCKTGEQRVWSKVYFVPNLPANIISLGQFPREGQYRASKVLELIHGDLCRPITPATTAGNKYFLLIVDDFSRYMRVVLLKRKDQALQLFRIVKMAAEVEAETKLFLF